MTPIDLALLSAGFVISWFGRKAWRYAEAEIAQRKHRRTLENLHWRY